MRFHPAQTLERHGFARAAESLRRLAWSTVSIPPPRHLRFFFQGLVWVPLAFVRRRTYRLLTEDDLRATRTSDTVFVFGSGGSLRDISDDEWRRIADHNTVAFSHFHRQTWVRVDYHMIAEVNDIEATARSFRTNPRYRDTVYLVMRGPQAAASNEMVARRLFPKGARLVRYRRVARGRTVPPSSSFEAGLAHGTNSVLDVVNFALLMGWTTVVLAGVDLYNRAYFFDQPAAGSAPVPNEAPFAQSRQVIEMLGLWRSWADARGIQLYIHDARSLAAEVLPVYAGPQS
jgi:hypothetical protein